MGTPAVRFLTHCATAGTPLLMVFLLNLLLHKLGFISELTQMANVNNILYIHVFAIHRLHLTRNLERSFHIPIYRMELPVAQQFKDLVFTAVALVTAVVQV